MFYRNLAIGTELKLGEWERPDNIDGPIVFEVGGLSE